MTDSKDKKITELQGSRAVFSKNLREIVIHRLGWSHKRFGQELEFSQAQATKYLNGISTPPFEKLDLIEQKTGVPIPEFFRSETDNPTPKSSKELKGLLQKLSDTNGNPLTEIHVLEGSKNDRLEDFLRDILQDHHISEAFLDLLAEGADQDTLQIEFLREYCQMLIASGSSLAGRAKKVLSDILSAEKGLKK